MILAALLLQAAAPAAATAVPMKESRIYEGIWVDIFEGQQFFVGARNADEIDTRIQGPWLDIDRLQAFRRALPTTTALDRNRDITSPHLYRVKFEGREAKDMNCEQRDHFGLPLCYGHQGQFRGIVIVDNLTAINDLGPLKSSSDNQH